MPFENPPVSTGQKLRSLLFNAVFYVNLVVFLLGGFFFMFTPRRWSMWALKQWAKSSLWWLKTITGTGFEIRGRKYIPKGATIVAGKHQSMWETFAILPLLDDPAIVLKRELLWIPVFGWFAQKFKMIAVDRGAGTAALKSLIKNAASAVKENRQIIIFPEGTRVPPLAAPDYKPGAAALYTRLKLPVTPFGLNSGLYWPRRRYQRYPGTIIIEFLEPIEAGLSRKQFSTRLESAIEECTTRLCLQGLDKDFGIRTGV